MGLQTNQLVQRALLWLTHPQRSLHTHTLQDSWTACVYIHTLECEVLQTGSLLLGGTDKLRVFESENVEAETSEIRV